MLPNKCICGRCGEGERCPDWDLVMYGHACALKQEDGTLRYLDPSENPLTGRQP